MGLRGDRFKVATCAASTAIWIATCGRPDVADVKNLQRVSSPLVRQVLMSQQQADPSQVQICFGVLMLRLLKRESNPAVPMGRQHQRVDWPSREHHTTES